jgi:hypothetical protein
MCFIVKHQKTPIHDQVQYNIIHNSAVDGREKYYYLLHMYAGVTFLYRKLLIL